MKISVQMSSLSGSIKSEINKGKRAATKGVHQSGNEMKLAFRRVVANSGLKGKRLQNSIRGRGFPKGADSFNPSYTIWSSANDIFQSHGQGAVIKPKKANYIIVPLPAAGKQNLTPEEWEQKHGTKLFFVKTGRRSAVLMAGGLRVQKTGRAIRSRAKNKRLHKIVPIFALVPQVKLTPKNLNFDHACQKVLQRTPMKIVAEWQR